MRQSQPQTKRTLELDRVLQCEASGRVWPRNHPFHATFGNRSRSAAAGRLIVQSPFQEPATSPEVGSHCDVAATFGAGQNDLARSPATRPASLLGRHWPPFRTTFRLGVELHELSAAAIRPDARHDLPDPDVGLRPIPDDEQDYYQWLQLHHLAMLPQFGQCPEIAVRRRRSRSRQAVGRSHEEAQDPLQQASLD